jgi:ABC-type sugar transport system substrate-binding protein
MVKNGDLRATVFQDGVGQITKAIELMVKVIGGETVKKRLYGLCDIGGR